jgi:hypothetical protein
MSFIMFVLGIVAGFLFGGLLPDQAKSVVNMIKGLFGKG